MSESLDKTVPWGRSVRRAHALTRRQLNLARRRTHRIHLFSGPLRVPIEGRVCCKHPFLYSPSAGAQLRHRIASPRLSTRRSRKQNGSSLAVTGSRAREEARYPWIHKPLLSLPTLPPLHPPSLSLTPSYATDLLRGCTGIQGCLHLPTPSTSDCFVT